MGGTADDQVAGETSGVRGASHDAVTGDLAAAIDALVGADPAVLGDPDVVLSLVGHCERLKSVVAVASSAFHRSKMWECEGARSGAAWIAGKAHLPQCDVKRSVSLGRRMADMAATASAWARGEVGEAHARALAVARQRVGPDAFDDAEEFLLAQARELSYSDFRRALEYWCQVADPDDAEERAEAQHASRRFHLSRSFEGAWFANGSFDAVGGTIVASTLQRIYDELFAADWAEARQRVGDGVRVDDLSRTPAQRRADAMVEMARRAGAVPSGARRPEPLVTVLVGYETLAGRICELADGTVVSPGSLLPLLEEAWVERVVFDAPDRPVNVGVRRRLFGGATRRAIEVRDRRCCGPYCEEPAARCEVDHVEPWAAGGLTTIQNGRLACGFHNRIRHRRPGADPDGPDGPRDPP